MNIIKRIGFYSIGFFIGLILLYFFVSGSGASCNPEYGPNARTLKNIRLKTRIYSKEATKSLNNYSIDTAAISNLLNNGDVIFSESNTKLDSCKQYTIEFKSKDAGLKARIENCDSIATIMTIEPLH